MTVKCTFCNDTKIEPGIPGPCVWCEQVGAAPVAVGYQLAKGFTDPVGDCEKFEAGITVNSWLQRIVVYGDSPADAEALRDHIMASAEREAALREELASELKELAMWKSNHASMVERAKLLRDRPDMPVERIAAFERMSALQQRLTVAEQILRDAKFLIEHSSYRICGASALIFGIEAALKPAAEGEGS